MSNRCRLAEADGRIDLDLNTINAERERLVWIEWQRRLNATIFEKLVALSHDQEVPAGLLERVQYKVTPFHFVWTLTGSGNALLDKLVSSAISVTLQEHHEVTEFPSCVKEGVHEHEAAFTTGGLAGYTTSAVMTDWRVRY